MKLFVLYTLSLEPVIKVTGRSIFDFFSEAFPDKDISANPLTNTETETVYCLLSKGKKLGYVKETDE